jgi:hypothetical protein
MYKIYASIFVAAIIVLAGVVIFYTPAASDDEIEKISVSEKDGKIHIYGNMTDGYMYRGFKLDSLAGNYFISIKHGLVGNKSFDITFDENDSSYKGAQSLERLYIMDNNGNKKLIYGSESE